MIPGEQHGRDRMKAKVLVVDDEQDILELVPYHPGRGATGSGVPGGESALDLVSRDRPDLGILDVMPGVDGYAADLVKWATMTVSRPRRTAARMSPT